MPLLFNGQGLLTPAEPIPVDLLTCEQALVEAFPHSDTRRTLWIHFLRYLENFQSRVSRTFSLWLNGSFVTRKANPHDLDFVVFLHYQVFEAHEPFLDKFWTFSLEAEGLDAYLVKTFPEDHPLHGQTQADRALWLALYQKTKWQADNTFYQKGFLALTFS